MCGRVDKFDMKFAGMPANFLYGRAFVSPEVTLGEFVIIRREKYATVFTQHDHSPCGCVANVPSASPLIHATKAACRKAQVRRAIGANLELPPIKGVESCLRLKAGIHMQRIWLN